MQVRGPLAACAIALVLALSGCELVTPHEALDAPVVEGTTAIDVGGARLRGLSIVADGVGPVSAGSLVVVALNDTDHDLAVGLTYPTRAGDRTARLEVPAGTSVSRGTRAGQTQLLLHDLSVRPGGVLAVRVTVGSGAGIVDVPVSNGSLPYDATLTPSPQASGGAAPSPLPGG